MNSEENKREALRGEILCLTDFSEESQHALRWATATAGTLGAHLTVLYSYRLLESKVEVFQKKRQTETEALQKFLKWETELLSNGKVEYKFRSEVGFMADRVEAFIQENTVLMLVINKGMMMDSNETIQQVIEHLKVPLVIVPDQKK